MQRYRLPNRQIFTGNQQHLSTTHSQSWLHSILPGVGLCVGLAWLATLLPKLPQLSILSSMILAIALGISVRNTIGISKTYEPGIRFTLRRLLRVAIALLGLQMSLIQVMEVGISGLAIVVMTLFSTFWFTCWLGQRLGVHQKLTHLIATGTSICGASAVIASNTVIDGTDEDAAYAVATVTLFGTISMFLYPFLLNLIHFSPQMFGIWCGASIHEVAQVVAAAFQAGTVSGQLATVAKLSRVLLLIPMILMLGIVSPKTRSSDRQLHTPLLPWFILVFIGLIGLNSSGILPITEKNMIISVNQFLLTSSMVAMGLETKLDKIMQSGLKPLYLAASAWLFISCFSFILITVIYS